MFVVVVYVLIAMFVVWLKWRWGWFDRSCDRDVCRACGCEFLVVVEGERVWLGGFVGVLWGFCGGFLGVWLGGFVGVFVVLVISVMMSCRVW